MSMTQQVANETTTQANVDFNAIKQRQKATWASGNYASIGTRLQIVGETLAEAVDLRAGERVLDVAAGNGNATLAAARRFAHVVSTDYVPELLEQGAARAKANGLAIEFRAADAEALPFENETFDVALSTFGVMFTPQQQQAAREISRVVRRGGRIGLANWTPEGFIGQLFRVIGSYIPAAAGLQSPMLWGNEPRIVEMFGPDAADIQCERRQYMFRFESAEHWLDVFRKYYGPMYKVFAALDGERQAQLADDIKGLLEQFNKGGHDSLVVPSEYLEIVITLK